MRGDIDYGEREDTAHDDWRQRLLDAREEGRDAGRLNLAADLCPYLAIEPEYNQWHEGRMETLGTQQRRVA